MALSGAERLAAWRARHLDLARARQRAYDRRRAARRWAVCPRCRERLRRRGPSGHWCRACGWRPSVWEDD